ncbi:MAG TPA: hypothetical protein VH661_06320 [Candidatus Dormibacteraeota bacterium]|nr:hypothetical protein [Candidatus Dormibacteraeota bacterium]
MADDAAHTPAGPARDSEDGGRADGVAEDAESIVAADIGAPSSRTKATSADGAQPTGRKKGTSTEDVRSRELVAVGAGEGERGASAPSRELTPEPSAWSGPRRDIADDRPHWTFPGVVAEPSVPGSPSEPEPTDANQAELPFVAIDAPALRPARPMPTFGPVGRSRSVVLVPVISMLTLGVYALAWHHGVNRELEEFDPKLHSRPRRSTAAVMVPWLAGLLVTLAGATLIITTRLGVHLPFNIHLAGWQAYALLAGLAAVPYLALLLPFSAVAVVMTLERLRSVEEHVGATTDRQVRPVGTSLFLAIPLVGGLMLLAIEQRRLNAIWHAMTTSGHLYS